MISEEDQRAISERVVERYPVELTPEQWALVWACVGPSTLGGSGVAPAHRRAALRFLTSEQVAEVGERVRRVARLGADEL